jgi:predicted Zn-ribbon and HTH transcriptional regulator
VSSLADIIRQYGTEYQSRHKADILPSHLKTMQDVSRCRTPELGGQTWHCDHCGSTHYSYHSCRNRHCPKCQHDRGQDWLQKQLELLLPVPYFMVTVTAPKELRAAMRHRQKTLYSLFFKASAKAIMTLARDKRFLGAEIGLFGVLQTWTKMIAYHPHIHFLIPGGGVIGNRWKWAKPDFLIHYKPLSRLMRRYFREELKKTEFFQQIPDPAWRKKWVCQIKPVGTGETALKYLAPYVFRVAISDRNILSVHNGQVTFQYKNRKTKSYEPCTLDVFTFIDRFLQHVLPRGFVKVRYFGLLATKKRVDLDRVKELIGRRLSRKSPPHPSKKAFVMRCPGCKMPMIFVGELPKQPSIGRGPPEWLSVN